MEQAISILERITVNPNQGGGRPGIRGMRIRVKDILELLAAGASREEILAEYPYFEPADITAGLALAAHCLHHPILRVAQRELYQRCAAAARPGAHAESSGV